MQAQHAVQRQSHAHGWRFLVAAILGLHGLIHVLGFFSTWQLGDFTAIPATPLYPSGLAAGSPVVLALGVLWLVTMAAFLLAAIGVVLRTAWWKSVAVSAACVSLVLCIAWWNSAWFGALVDVAVLLGVLISTRETRQKSAVK